MTSVEWCPFESSVLTTTSGDGQLAVWDLALERDPEEEAALAASMNAASPDDLPAQLLFVHLGQVRLPSLVTVRLHGDSAGIQYYSLWVFPCKAVLHQRVSAHGLSWGCLKDRTAHGYMLKAPLGTHLPHGLSAANSCA